MVNKETNMDTEKLLEQIEQDLRNVSAPYQAHAQIQNILQAYKNRIKQNGEQNKEENV